MNVTPIKAKAIGKARLSDNLVGATPLALLRSTWEAIPLAGPNIDDALAVKIDAFGVLVNPMDVSEKFGHITSSDGTEVGILDGTSNAVFLGHLCAEPNAAQLQTFNPESFAESIRSNAICYVVIIPNAGSPVEDRAIGFGFIEVSILDPAPSPTFLIRKRANQHAYENASAAVVKEIPEFNLIWSEHTSLMTPLLAPALVR